MIKKDIMFKALIVKPELVCLKNMPLEWKGDISVHSAICLLIKPNITPSTILNQNIFQIHLNIHVMLV